MEYGEVVVWRQGHSEVYRANVLLVASNSLHLWGFRQRCPSAQILFVLNLFEQKAAEQAKIRPFHKSLNVSEQRLEIIKWFRRRHLDSFDLLLFPFYYSHLTMRPF